MADDKPTISTMQRAFARRLAGPCRVFSSAAAATNHAAVSDALTLGGDSRLLLDAAHGWNKYFCPPRPVVDNAVLRGSCTCSPPTADGYAHALERHAALEPHRGSADYATHFEAEMESVRSRLGRSLGLSEGTGIVLAASGTDAEYVPLAIAQELYPGATVHSVLAAKEEVGSGCVEAAAGEYFDPYAPYARCEKGARLAGFEGVVLHAVASRAKDGSVVDTAAAMASAVADGAAAAAETSWVVRVVTGTKTGFTSSALDLPAQMAERAFTVVDACQTRLQPSAVRAHLDAGAMVMVTGSKFMQGAAFSGAVLIPPALMTRLAAGAASAPPLPAGMADFFSTFEVPVELGHWRAQLHSMPNEGALARWHTALPQMERMAAVGDARRTALEEAWTAGVVSLVEASGNLEVLTTEMGIVSIRCKKADGSGYHAMDDLRRVHPWLASDVSAAPAAPAAAGTKVFLGQPVKITSEQAVLRIALGAELLAEIDDGNYDQASEAPPVEKLSWAIREFDAIKKWDDARK